MAGQSILAPKPINPSAAKKPMLSYKNMSVSKFLNNGAFQQQAPKASMVLRNDLVDYTELKKS